MNVIPSIVALIAFAAVLIFFYVLRRMKIFGSGFALINILINFLQTVWLLRKVRLDWPSELLSLIDYINLLNFNIELVSPECIIQSSLNFSQKMRIILALPIVLLILAIVLMFISTFFKSTEGTRRRGTQNSVVKYLTSGGQYGIGDVQFRWGLMKIFNITLSILYVNIASKSLSFFDCTLEDDGRAYLDEEVSLVCYASWWYQDLPLGVLAVVVYVIGIPTYFAILYFLSYQTNHQEYFYEKCRKNSRGIMQGDGDFKPEYQYFIVVQLTHKLAIVAISLFFSR
ncbi:hypothetical protein BKA69DRAFT_465463 [Paraphysoderma sedebokerense]|nr:hypothetical protein BKA69DRAFT_465463 [Paraphysoderma sedebokerense]